MMKKKYVTEKSKDYSLLDNNTGEILEYNQVKKVSIEEFIMVFFASYPELMKLEGQKLKMLMMCWKLSTFGGKRGNIVINDSSFKEEVRKYEPKMSNSNIDACFSYLTAKGIMRRICKGRYELNSDYFFKGSLSDRSHLQFCVEVDPKKEVKMNSEGRISFCMFARSINIVEKNH